MAKGNQGIQGVQGVFWLALVLILAGVGYYFYRQSSAPLPEPLPAVEEETIAQTPAEPGGEDVAGDAATTQAEPTQRFPVEPAPVEQEALPELAQSDAPLRQQLETLAGRQPVEAWLLPQHLIERIVVAINSLDGDPVPMRIRPLRHVPGLFRVIGDGAQYSFSPDNAARYAPYVKAFSAIDPDALARLYLRWYPLFQEAYAALGNPHAPYFNDRLIDIIDHLLQAPDVDASEPLVRPKVLYQYLDPTLESRSWGQKILMRMGSAHAAATKRQLQRIRQAILAQAQPQPQPTGSDVEPDSGEPVPAVEPDR